MPGPIPYNTVCIFGAGALGGAVAASLAAANGVNLRVSVVARGTQLDEIRRSGLRLLREGGDAVFARVEATDDPTALVPQDLVITTVKGHQFPAAADGIAALLAPHTRVLTILNGIPWWYGHGDVRGAHCAPALEMLDPGGKLRARVGAARVIGCVAHYGAEVLQPGTVSATREGRFILGEPTGSSSADLDAAAALLAIGHWRAEKSARIRDDIWNKLMGNAAFNPISTLTRATLSDIIANSTLTDVVCRAMTEVRDVGTALGAENLVDVKTRMSNARRLGPIRSSMLQDFERGRRLEIVPLLGVVSALGRIAGTATPTLDTLGALVTQLDESNRAV